DEDDPIAQLVGHQDAIPRRAAAVEPRSTSSVASSSGVAASPASERSAWANPSRPSSRSGIRTVESAGAVRDAIELSSQAGTGTRLWQGHPAGRRPLERAKRE